MLQGVDSNDHREANHINAKTNENGETDKPILVSFCVVADLGNQRVHYRVKECVIDDDDNRSHNIVNLIEFLEDHIVLANLIFFIIVIGFVVFSQFWGQLVKSIISITLIG